MKGFRLHESTLRPSCRLLVLMKSFWGSHEGFSTSWKPSGALMKASRLHEGYLGPLVKAFPLHCRFPEALMKASRLHEGYLGPLVKAFPLHESSLKPTGSPHEGFSSSRRLSGSLVKAFPLHESSLRPSRRLVVIMKAPGFRPILVPSAFVVFVKKRLCVTEWTLPLVQSLHFF